MADKKDTTGGEPEAEDEGAGGKPEPEGESEYQVGYGKPPPGSRFKNGNKAGKGRKTGSRNLRTIVNEAANAKTPVVIKGKKIYLSKLQLAMYQLANKAAAGDLKAIDKFAALAERYEPREDPADPTPEQLAPDIETLRDYLAFSDMINSVDDEDGNEDRDEAA